MKSNLTCVKGKANKKVKLKENISAIVNIVAFVMCINILTAISSSEFNVVNNFSMVNLALSMFPIYFATKCIFKFIKIMN